MGGKNINTGGAGAGGDKVSVAMPSSLEHEELTQGPGEQVLPNLPGVGAKGAAGPSNLEPEGLQRCGAPASPLSPSAGGEAGGASWNDIGRSANQARGCSWSCHLGEEPRTHARQGSPASVKGARRVPGGPQTPLCLSVRLLGFRISP